MKSEIVNNILTETKQIYDRIAPDFAITRNKWWTAFGDFGKHAKDGDNILDIGCGNGRMATLFENLNVNYLGIDNSSELIKIASNRFKEKNNVKFEVGEASDLNLRENKFDIVLMMAVLHHIPTSELRLKILKDINALMKKDGMLIMSNWNLWQLGYWKKYWPRLLDYNFKIKKGVWSLKDGFIPWRPIGNKNQRYVHSFTLRELKRLLSQSGFKVETASYENMGKPAGFLNGFNSMVIARKK